MLKKFKAFTFAKTFEFKDPDSGFHYKAESFPELITSIKNYREQNELPPLEYLETVVESYLCSLPDHAGMCHPLPKVKRGLLQYIRGGIALLKDVAYNSFVRPEVANARSLICRECPLNTFPDKGPFIKWSDNVAFEAVGNRRSTYHDDLGTCSGCGCPLRAKVWASRTAIKLKPYEKVTMINANPNCWQISEDV